MGSVEVYVRRTESAFRFTLQLKRNMANPSVFYGMLQRTSMYGYGVSSIWNKDVVASWRKSWALSLSLSLCRLDVHFNLLIIHSALAQSFISHFVSTLPPRLSIELRFFAIFTDSLSAPSSSPCGSLKLKSNSRLHWKCRNHTLIHVVACVFQDVCCCCY